MAGEMAMAKAEVNMAHVKELAKTHKALVLIVENRYFGASLPLGLESFTPENIAWLTLEQSMMDTVKLIRDVKYKYYIEAFPTITFGGTFGGMMATWLRMEYPSII